MNQNLATAARHCAVGLLAATTVLPLQAALAADLIVTKFTDSLDGSCDSDCSLREAVQKANRTPGASRIILAAGTYRLSLPPQRDPDSDGETLWLDDDDNLDGDLDIKGRLTIVGRGIDATIIDAGGIDRIAEALPDAVATLGKLTVAAGRNKRGGGGLWVNAGATLSLQSAKVINNTVSVGFDTAFGGGILNEGTLNIDASEISFNSTGAGDSNTSAGGGIYNLGSLVVRDARFFGNNATNDDDRGDGGAIYNKGTADIRRASFQNNEVRIFGSGAAIFNTGFGVLRVENSTISGSTNGGEPASWTGAIENGDRFGPSVTARASLVNTTIADNPIFGLVNRARVSITNSIIAGNGQKEDPVFGVPGVDANCMNVGPDARFFQAGLLRGTDSGNCPSTLLVLNADSFVTLMYPLAANSSQLPTFALRPGSIAVDAAVGACPSTDQRRVTRPRDGNGDGIAACDLGAYERPKP